MRQIIKNMPFFGLLACRIYRRWVNTLRLFEGSESYWENRYKSGRNSGAGSYNQLAEFKADILNTFVFENEIASVIEYGCGDGNQLSLAQYPKYIGFDVSPTAISMCRKRFSNDETKTFKLNEEYDGESAELTISLDVIYHLVEDVIFIDYMNRLFDSSERFVIIYSSDTDKNPKGMVAPHLRHRKFSKWIIDNKTGWKLVKHIPNKYPVNDHNQIGSCADFYIYVRTEQNMVVAQKHGIESLPSHKS